MQGFGAGEGGLLSPVCTVCAVSTTRAAVSVLVLSAAVAACDLNAPDGLLCSNTPSWSIQPTMHVWRGVGWVSGRVSPGRVSGRACRRDVI